MSETGIEQYLDPDLIEVQELDLNSDFVREYPEFVDRMFMDESDYSLFGE